MIRELRIRNLAIIESLCLEFDDRLNILTGETGAGKSIILGALRLVLGERASSDDVRTGADSAEAEALIDGPLPSAVLELLREAELPADPDGLVVRREISAAGKSKAVVNGKLTPVGTLKAIGDCLVDIHGQHQHQSLLSAEQHLEALDAFGEIDAELEATRAAHASWSATRSALRRLMGNERALERERDMLEHQVAEIEQAALEPGEDERLGAERARLRNAEQLREAAARAHALLRENEADAPSATDLIGAAEPELAELARLDESQAGVAEQLENLRIQLDELGQTLLSYADSLESDPNRLRQVDDRLDLIRNLKRKHGDSIEEMLEALETYRSRLDRLVNRSDEIERLETRLKSEAAKLAEAAVGLSEKRRKTARRFANLLIAELSELQMPKAKFEVDFQRDGAAEGEGVLIDGEWVAAGPNGFDRIEFLLSTNPGEALKPLRRIASGGELSRIMLAMKSLLAQRDSIPTLLFDEIDVGVSGATAQSLAEKMRALAESHQLICITHLPQIAARATRHLAVEKAAEGKRTVTRVRALTRKDRVEELARLLGGDADSAAGRKHAAELLEKSA